MAEESAFRPSSNVTTRRRSLFEDEDNPNQEKHNQTVFKSLPEEQSEIYYPEDYIEKVKSEIEEWRMQVESILSKEIPESEIPKLENATVNENVLTAKQLDFLHSVSLDSYMQRVQRFCTRAAIFVNTAFYKPENETEQWYVAAQRKIEKELCDKHE